MDDFSKVGKRLPTHARDNLHHLLNRAGLIPSFNGESNLEFLLLLGEDLGRNILKRCMRWSNVTVRRVSLATADEPRGQHKVCVRSLVQIR